MTRNTDESEHGGGDRLSESEFWHVLIDGEARRVTLDELDGMFQRGDIGEDNLVWKKGMRGWIKLGLAVGLDNDDVELFVPAFEAPTGPYSGALPAASKEFGPPSAPLSSPPAAPPGHTGPPAPPSGGASAPVSPAKSGRPLLTVDAVLPPPPRPPMASRELDAGWSSAPAPRNDDWVKELLGDERLEVGADVAEAGAAGASGRGAGAPSVPAPSPTRTAPMELHVGAAAAASARTSVRPGAAKVGASPVAVRAGTATASLPPTPTPPRVVRAVPPPTDAETGPRQERVVRAVPPPTSSSQPLSAGAGSLPPRPAPPTAGAGSLPPPPAARTGSPPASGGSQPAPQAAPPRTGPPPAPSQRPAGPERPANSAPAAPLPSRPQGSVTSEPSVVILEQDALVDAGPRTGGTRRMIVWLGAAAAAFALVVTAYRHDALYDLCAALGAEGPFTGVERALFGGPAFGTVRSVRELVAKHPVDFSEIELPAEVTLEEPQH